MACLKCMACDYEYGCVFSAYSFGAAEEREILIVLSKNEIPQRANQDGILRFGGRWGGVLPYIYM